MLYSSALTGLGDTRTPFYANTAIYWVIGGPLSYYLAFHTPLALTGLWMGRTVAAVLTGAVMAVAWRVRIRQAEGGRTARAPFTLLNPVQVE